MRDFIDNSFKQQEKRFITVTGLFWKVTKFISNIFKKKIIMQLTKNFKLSEFACNDGTPVPSKFYENVKEVAENLQVLRDYFNEHKEDDEEEITITPGSGYRTPKYNKKVKGARLSQHKKAKAADPRVKNRTPNEVHATIILLIKSKKMKQGGVGLYDTFVHYDTRGYRARWDKRKRI
ncbi:hypothetical protein LCGC14_0692830 [marine sediment metagenome]|uniref:Peptidase M15A C-terminal domain-containing protein n=1 Tax=marine sediment metagenome TaxID=412755 RepID=A0A0F9T693_9ZZZZ